jgi:CubicO group peptidase (beta-lactamase class C family)
MITGFSLEETLRSARAATGVPGAAVGLVVGGDRSFAADGVCALGRSEPVRVETPFRIASITKPFTATLCAEAGVLDDGVRACLSHTSGLRCESDQLLPESCLGLWSYSNSGYWAAARRAVAASGGSFEEAVRRQVLEPLGLEATGFEEPEGCARGHVQEGESGHRLVPDDVYPVARRPSGGLWSTVADLLRFGERHLDRYDELHRPVVSALGAAYALGWWVREVGGRTVLDHEGSVGGYQSLLLLVPGERLALAVLTNSWRGSGLVRRVVAALDLAGAEHSSLPVPESVVGTYGLDAVEAVVARDGGSVLVTTAETDPVTDARIEVRFPARPLSSGTVFGFCGGILQSHRLDFPRPDVARIGWVALPRVER